METKKSVYDTNHRNAQIKNELIGFSKLIPSLNKEVLFGNCINSDSENPTELFRRQLKRFNIKEY